MTITFLVSSVFHELVMSCITKKLRGYGFLAMMLQLPIVAVQKSRFFRGRTTLNVSCSYVDQVSYKADLTSECVLLVFYDFGSFDGKLYSVFLTLDISTSIFGSNTGCSRCVHSTSWSRGYLYLRVRYPGHGGTTQSINEVSS
jgi:sterol O-acyltransferase